MYLTEVLNFFPAFGPTDDGTNGQKQHIVEGIVDFFVLALVMNVSKKLSKNGINRHR